MSPVRAVLGSLGVGVGGYGAWLLLSRQDADQLLGAATWFVAGVVLHDAVIAPLSLLVVLVGARLLPRPARAPALVGLVVLGSVTLLAVPVLGRFGARPDNATLLDRDYTVGWFVVAGVVLVGVVAASLAVRSHDRSRGAGDEQGDGRGGGRGTGARGRRRSDGA